MRICLNLVRMICQSKATGKCSYMRCQLCPASEREARKYSRFYLGVRKLPKQLLLSSFSFAFDQGVEQSKKAAFGRAFSI